MTGGIILLSITLLWWSGVFFAWSFYGWAFTCSALGAGWLGIIYGALQRSLYKKRIHGTSGRSDSPAS